MGDEKRIKKRGIVLMWSCRLGMVLLLTASAAYWLLYNTFPQTLQLHYKTGISFPEGLGLQVRILLFFTGLISLFPQVMLLFNLQKGFRMIASGELFSKGLVSVLRKAALWSLVFALGKLLLQWLQPFILSIFDNNPLFELSFSFSSGNLIPLLYFLILSLFSMIWEKARENHEENQLTI